MQHPRLVTNLKRFFLTIGFMLFVVMSVISSRSASSQEAVKGKPYVTAFGGVSTVALQGLSGAQPTGELSAIAVQSTDSSQTVGQTGSPTSASSASAPDTSASDAPGQVRKAGHAVTDSTKTVPVAKHSDL